MTWLIIIIVVVILFAVLSKKDPPKTTQRPHTRPQEKRAIPQRRETTQPRRQPAVNESDSSALYRKAKDLAQCLFDFPYKDPASVPPSVRQDRPLMEIIAAAHKTTIGPDGNTQQTTIDSAERVRLQAEFKTRIYALLDKCLAEDPEHAPALLLYPKVADWNTRKADLRFLLDLYERLLPAVEKVTKGTRAYGLIEKDIEGMGGNYFDKVERHLSDFHYELGQLYMKADLVPEAIAQFERAETLMPPIYAGTIGKAYAGIGEYEKALEHMEKALKVRMDKSSKDLLKSDYNNVKAMMKEAAEDAEELQAIAEKVIPIIDQAPGILQKDLFTRFPAEDKRTISGLLRTLEQEGLITRKKKGSTYQLTLSKPVAEVLTELRETERE